MTPFRSTHTSSEHLSPSTPSLQDGDFVLMWAVGEGREGAVELLLNNNADPNLQDKVQHMAPPLSPLIPSAPSA